MSSAPPGSQIRRPPSFGPRGSRHVTGHCGGRADFFGFWLLDPRPFMESAAERSATGPENQGDLTVRGSIPPLSAQNFRRKPEGAWAMTGPPGFRCQEYGTDEQWRQAVDGLDGEFAKAAAEFRLSEERQPASDPEDVPVTPVPEPAPASTPETTPVPEPAPRPE